MKKGFVLIYAVVIVGVLFIVAVATVSSIVSEFQFAVKEIESIKAFYAADTGIECARYYQETAGAFNTTSNETTYDCGVGSFTAGKNPPDFLCDTKSYAFTSGSFSNNACFTLQVEAKQDLDDPQLCDVSIISRGTGNCLVSTVALERGRWETWVGLPTGSGSVTAGLVSHLPLDETTGTIANDVGPGGNDGTLTNFATPPWTLGKIGNAIHFGSSGGTEHINLGSGSSLDNLPAITVSAWIKAEGWLCGSEGTIPDNRGVIVAKGLNPPQGWWFVCSSISAFTDVRKLVFTMKFSGIYLQVKSSDGVINTSGTVWHHVAGVWDGSVTSAAGTHVYVNGVDVSSWRQDPAGTRGDDQTATMIIGNSDDQSMNDTFNGLIDDVRVYNRALSPNEVRQLCIDGGGSC